MSTQPTLPPYPSNFAGRDEHADAERFAHALRPPPSGLHIVQNVCPPVTPHPAALDVLLFRAVLLVAYAATDEVVIARGTDLDALRRLRCAPTLRSAPVTAISFRTRDAALAVAFSNVIVVFEGWSPRAIENKFVYTEDFLEATLDLEQWRVKGPVVSLSWNSEGTMLCAIADSILVWTLDRSHMPAKYQVSQTIPHDAIPSRCLAMGALSPDGSFIAASALYTRKSYVWTLPRRKPNSVDDALSCAEIVHGRSGIATMDWKKRGGGNQALMTIDRDGTIRLWVKTASSSRTGVAVPNRPQLATGVESWMEEIARSPHTERTPRAGAAFLDWGGGGGVADDEGDALATNATLPFLAEGTAPKPSRCYHWIVRIAGGDARAWRVRGLDDRPRAEFTRLEPGTGEPLVGIEAHHRDDLGSAELPLRGVSVVAMKAVAPIPLTTVSEYKVGLVKSYAISNGERRLRSPEPPEPPTLVAIFVLAISNGLPYLARHDICPTSKAPSTCRARIGVGHSSEVVDLVTSDQYSNSTFSSDGWLASRGRNGDVIVWRTNVSTGAWEPMTAVAALPGPHTAVTFAPPRTTSPNLWELGVFACDSALGSLRLFQFVNFVNKKENASTLDIQFAKPIAVCHPRGKGLGEAVKQLIAIPLGVSLSDPLSGIRCALFGVRDGGRLRAWSISRRRKEEIVIEPLVIRFGGGRHRIVTCAAANETASPSRQIFVTGGDDGSVFVYRIAESGAQQEANSINDSEDEESEEGVVWLKDICHLESPAAKHSPVERVEVSFGGARIMALHANGKSVIWYRSNSDNTEWNVELNINGGRESMRPGDSTDLDSTALEKVDCTASIGHDLDGNFSVVVMRRDGTFQRYRRVWGMPWECVQKNEIPCHSLPSQKRSIQHIGKGVIAISNGRGISVLTSTKPGSHPLSFVSGAAGYSPSKALMAQLLTGGRAWQLLETLDELHSFVGNMTKQKVSETSYSAGRGLIPPPPPLSMLLSDKDKGAQEVKEISESEKAALESEISAAPLQMGTAKSIFARLMAKSEAAVTEDEKGGDAKSAGSDAGRSRHLSKLANSLKLASIASVTRSEQSVLAAIARASSFVRNIFESLDSCGARFALIAACHLEISKTDPIPLPVVASAVHSLSGDALLDYFLPPVQPRQEKSQEKTKMWDRARVLGAGWWVTTSSGAKALAERIARSDFNTNRDVDDTALWYIALGRRTTLSALYRSQQNSRMAQFLRRNFSLPENRLAAGKNAYVLLSKHRFELAIAFFILGGDIQGALNLVRTRMRDDQLAILLARVMGDDDLVYGVLQQIVKSAEMSGDDHRKSLALWLIGEFEEALKTAGEARYPPKEMKMSYAEQMLSGSLPGVVHALSHVLAIASRPAIMGTSTALSTIEECRRRASRALVGDGSPVAALFLNLERLRATDDSKLLNNGGYLLSKSQTELSQSSLFLAAVDTLKGRAVCFAGAVRSGAHEKNLQEILYKDIQDLVESPLGVEITIKAVEGAVFELGKEDEVDSAVAATCAVLQVLKNERSRHSNLLQTVEAAQRNCLRVAVSRALFHVQGALSLLHHTTFSSQRLSELLSKYIAASSLVEKAESQRNDLYRRLVLEFRGAVVSLRFAKAFLRGDWPGILHSLRSCEMSWQYKLPALSDDAVDREAEDSSSMTSGCSSFAPDSVSVEALRHVASNPAILGLSRSLDHMRRYRKTPSMSMVGISAGATATVADDSIIVPTLAVRTDDPFAVIRIHPALSSTLAAACAAYLASHLAALALAFSKHVAEETKRGRSSQHIWQPERGKGYDQSFRLIRAAEELEQIAEDAIAQWTPLQHFGGEANAASMSHPDESAGAFVDLWSTLGCLPEYAPSLSEAATVAAAEMAAAASRAAIEAAEQKDGGRRRRRRRERRGEVVQSVAKEGLKLFDTTSADSLYGAYPVRFSASASGPWSGRGRHASLYREDRALFRTLCLSSTDPPAVIVSTPKGIQEIVPSSYTTIPAGFRSHYALKRAEINELDRDERLEALAKRRDLDFMEARREEDDSFLSSYDGFGEGPYVALELEANEAGKNRSQQQHSRGQEVVWRHQVHATTLASYPLRRRFASGGTDGVIRLWDFADPISLASFRENFGRVSDLSFSAYGNTMLAVYASGHVTIWDDPDMYSSNPRGGKGRRGARTKAIQAFDNRAASAGTFLDERHTVAVVGDPTAPPAVHNSLRVFDTREPNSSFHASWSATVNHQSEAKCLALLEDRMRLVTGGLDGSLSVVDIRTRTCVAELPAHLDEVTSVALEMPRGRALVSGSANGEIKLWDSRTLLLLDVIPDAHMPTRHYWSGNGFGGFVGSYGTQGLALTDRSLISCGGDGVVKIWGPGWSDFDLNVL